MKTIKIFMLFLGLSVAMASCESGQNAPADSHPGSGSVKAGNQNPPKDTNDSLKQDTAKKTN